MTASGRATLSIGQVLAALKSEFSDISVSKIRFLESEGLLTPERTASGYRKFAPADVDRLRTILRLQRDAFMPLRVIKERLAAIDAGLEAPPAEAPEASSSPSPPLVAVPAAPTHPVVEDEFAEPAPVRLTEADLIDATGLEPAQIKQLAEFGLLESQGGNGSTYYDGDDLAVATLVRRLIGLGLDVRHLRSMKRSAEQDAELFQQLLTPLLRNRRPEMRDQALETLTELVRTSRQLRRAYVRRSLRPIAGGDR